MKKEISSIETRIESWLRTTLDCWKEDCKTEGSNKYWRTMFNHERDMARYLTGYIYKKDDDFNLIVIKKK